jgi:hypothetical protein
MNRLRMIRAPTSSYDTLGPILGLVRVRYLDSGHLKAGSTVLTRQSNWSCIGSDVELICCCFG